MADVRIPISIQPNLAGLQSLSRLVDDTRTKLASLEGWEMVPGGGIRRRGSNATPGAGTYTTPSMASPSATFQSATPHVRTYTAAVSQATQQAGALSTALQQIAQVAPIGASPGGRRPLSGRALQLLGAQVAGGDGGGAAGGSLLPTGSGPWAGWTGMMPPPGGGSGWGGWTGMLPQPPMQPPGGRQRRPPPPSDDDDDDSPGMIRRAFGRVQRVARTALGVTAGIGIYQTLSHAMQLYEQRARGVIAVGMQLGQQFDAVGGTIDHLRTRYQVLAHDSLAAMSAMGRVTGRFTGLEQAIAFGTAYGIAPGQAAGMAGLAQRLTTGEHPLAAMGTARHLYGVNYQAMAMEPLLDETTRMAQLGGSLGVRMPASFYGRMASTLGGMGEQMQVPGAIAGFFGQLTKGMAHAPDEAIYAMRMQALGRLREQRRARGQGTTIDIGGEPIDLSSTFGMETAMELAGFSPAIEEAYREQARLMTGGREDLMPRAFYSMIGGRQIGRLQSEQYRRSSARQPGGVLGRLRPADIGAEEAAGAERLQNRLNRPEFLSQAMEARYEGGLEQIGEKMVTLSNELKKAIADLAGAAQGGTMDVTKLTDAVKSLSGESRVLLGILTTLSAQSTTGQLLGLGLAGSGFMNFGTDPKGFFNIPQTLPELQQQGPRILSTQPQRQGP